MKQALQGCVKARQNCYSKPCPTPLKIGFRKSVLEVTLQGSAKFIDDGLYSLYYPLAEILLAAAKTLPLPTRKSV
ncbi:MAG: hypothetical protein J6R09_04740, partial [Alistipes sp.]|nr:hypothetical protein [Alistipes sp.]